jgi:prevent-host-death family protein
VSVLGAGPFFIDGGEGDAKKIENIREVKTRFSRYVKELPKSGSVLITKNGRPCAALVPVTEDTDLEALALSQNKRFWNDNDRAWQKRGLRLI